MELGFALCGSFCTFHRVFPVMEALAARHHILPILSEAVQTVDSRFGSAREHWQRIREITGEDPLCTLVELVRLWCMDIVFFFICLSVC